MTREELDELLWALRSHQNELETQKMFKVAGAAERLAVVEGLVARYEAEAAVAHG